jgi:hypothetical protein
VLALLAFAGGPALAQAEVCDASCIEYGGDGPIPHAGLHGQPQHPNSGGGRKAESTPNKPHQGGGGAESPEAETEDDNQGKHAGGGGGSGDAGGNTPGKGGGSPQAGEPGGGTGADRGGGDAGAAKAPISDPGGGSSPLIPVLIAIAVLAALSFAAVVYRHRRRIPVG